MSFLLFQFFLVVFFTLLLFLFAFPTFFNRFFHIFLSIHFFEVFQKFKEIYSSQKEAEYSSQKEAEKHSYFYMLEDEGQFVFVLIKDDKPVIKLANRKNLEYTLIKLCAGAKSLVMDVRSLQLVLKNTLKLEHIVRLIGHKAIPPAVRDFLGQLMLDASNNDLKKVNVFLKANLPKSQMGARNLLARSKTYECLAQRKIYFGLLHGWALTAEKLP
jgi:hypothetical protein